MKLHKILGPLFLALLSAWLLAPRAGADPRGHGPVESPEMIAISQLPAPGPSSGKFYTVYDSLDGTCGAGHGVIIVYCQSNGTSYVARQVQGTGGGGGSGHVIQQGGVSLTPEPIMNYHGDGVVVTDDSGNTRTDVYIPGYTVRLNQGSTATGIVTCPSEPNLPAGLSDRCTGVFTAFGGQTFIAGEYITVTGSYNAADPSTATAGFYLDKAYFPSDFCNNASQFCGTYYKSFQAQLNILSGIYGTVNPGNVIAPARPQIVFNQGLYQLDSRFPMYQYGTNWALNMCNGPSFHMHPALNGDLAVRTMPGTATVNTSTDDTLITLSVSACNSGNCYDGDEFMRPGDRLRLVGTGDSTWKTDKVVILRGFDDTSGTKLRIMPPLTSNFSGTIEVGYGKLWQFDGQSTAHGVSGPQQFYGGTEILCPTMARVICDGICLPENPYVSPARTNAGGYRRAPLQMVVQNEDPFLNQMQVTTPCGRNDSSLTFTGANVAGGTGSIGGFNGILSGCFSGAEAKEQLDGSDPNSATDDGVGAMVTIIGNNFTFNTQNLVGAMGRGFIGAGTLHHINGDRLEDFLQAAWYPIGALVFEWDGLSEEQQGLCDGSYPTPCDLASVRHAFFDFGRGSTDNLTLYSYRISFPQMFQFNRPTTFLRINQGSATVGTRVQFNNGMVRDSSKLFDFPGGGPVTIVGDLGCDVGSGPDPNVCTSAQSASANFDNFGLWTMAGTSIWNGRKLNDMAGTLNLAKITDDDAHAAHTTCVVNGGSGGNPIWQTCAGNTLAALVGDVAISAPTAGQYLQYDGAHWANQSPIWTYDGSLVANRESDTTIDIQAGNVGGGFGLQTLLAADGSTFFNRAGTAVDFVVGSVTGTSFLHLIGSSGRWGIGTDTPAQKLDVVGVVKATSFLAGSAGLSAVEGAPGSCGALEYWLRPNTTGHKWQKCQDTVISDIGAGGSGTVTSVGVSVPAALLAVSGTPVTTSGIIALTLVTQTANCVFSGPTSGGAATPTCRTLVAADIPSVDSAKITDGTIVDADVAVSAAIAGSKINPDFGSQTIKGGAIIIACGGTGDCINTLSSNGATDFAAPASGDGNIGMVSGEFRGRLNGEGASTKFLRTPDVDTSAELAAILTDESGTSGGFVRSAGGALSALTALGIRSTGAAHDLLFATSEVTTADRTISWVVNDANRTVSLAGNLTLAAAFTTSGANALTLTTTGATNVTLPTSGTLLQLAPPDGVLVDLSAINDSSTSEGLKLPQANDVSAATAEGQVGWDKDDDALYIGDGATAKRIGPPTCVNPTMLPTGLFSSATGSGTTAITGTAGTLRCIKVRMPCDKSITTIALEITTGAASQVASVAIYSLDGNTKIVASGIEDASSALVDTETVSAKLLANTEYWACGATSATATVAYRSVANLLGVGLGVIGSNQSNVLATNVAQFNAACTSGSTPYACCSGSGTGTCTGMPSTLGALTDSNSAAWVIGLAN